jgi:hypothetical protein
MPPGGRIRCLAINLLLECNMPNVYNALRAETLLTAEYPGLECNVIQLKARIKYYWFLSPIH